ncbi:unnamed protein product [Trichobilharzia regenti]|nr:unnamed protein product [Trichobilharzia regenti]
MLPSHLLDKQFQDLFNPMNTNNKSVIQPIKSTMDTFSQNIVDNNNKPGNLPKEAENPLATGSHATKVPSKQRKLGEDELDKYCNLILPQKPNERSFDETVHTLRHQFGDQRSCMKLVLNENDNIHTQLGIVNRTCERFKFKSFSEDQFKVLIFICGFQSPKFADIRTRLLNRPRMTLKDVGEEYQRLVNIHNDTALVQSGSQNAAEVHAVHPVPSTSTAPIHPQHKPPSACWHCGSWHFVNLRPFKQHKYHRCHTVGHKDGYCKRNNRPRSRSRPRRLHMPKS